MPPSDNELTTRKVAKITDPVKLRQIINAQLRSSIQDTMTLYRRAAQEVYKVPAPHGEQNLQALLLYRLGESGLETSTSDAGADLADQEDHTTSPRPASEQEQECGGEASSVLAEFEYRNRSSGIAVPKVAELPGPPPYLISAILIFDPPWSQPSIDNHGWVQDVR
ncbi:hypothetical protein K438DRAFT_1771363 [Mycena galopus ATCC 62051]|nr:hypothetical protein K438DRAFT_1771363 [Mycena galopus ATCC 62051]